MQGNLVAQAPSPSVITQARMLEFTFEGIYPAELLTRRDFFSIKVLDKLEKWLLSHGWSKNPLEFGLASGWRYSGQAPLTPMLGLREAVLSNAARLVEEHLVSIGYHVVRSNLGHVWNNHSRAAIAPGEYTKNKRRPKRGKHWMSLRAAARQAGLFPPYHRFVTNG
jgi:hypothetical protein